MSTTGTRSRTPQTVRITYQAIRNLTSPEEKLEGIQTYFANLPVREIVKLATGHNLRDYIAEHNARKRNQVHRAIRDSLENEPTRFINRNSGVTVCCSNLDLDEKTRILTLYNASLVNGAQTQGEINAFLNDIDSELEALDAGDPVAFHVRAEINVDPDEESVIETAIARNTATSVKSISQAGARGILDDLESSFHKGTARQITTSETDDAVGLVDTKLLLQLTRLIMPPQLRPSSSEAETLKPYKNKEKCLQEFADWYRDKDSDEQAKRRYWFTVSMATEVWTVFERLNHADDWNGHRLHEVTKSGGRAVRRDEKKKVVWVAPGILFPMIHAYSAFVVETENGWGISQPTLFNDAELISRAVKQFRAHDLDPYTMGRTGGAYEALSTYTETIVQVLAMTKPK